MDGSFTNDTVTGLYNDTYYWRVRAVDDLANGGSYSSTRGFVTDTIVNQVSLSLPADGHETSAINIVVSWSAVSDSVGVDSYAVEVSKNTSFSNIAFTDTIDQAFTSDTVTGLYNDTYYWRVRAVDDLANGGSYSATRGFVTDTIVNTVSLSQPADGHETTSINVVVSWSAASDSVGVDSYSVEVSKNTGFTNIAFTDTLDQAFTSDTVTGLYNDTYYWRVRVVDDLANSGSVSSARGFVTDTIVNKPTLTSPANNAVIADTTPTLTWLAVSDSVGIDSYVLHISKGDSTFSAILHEDTRDAASTDSTTVVLYGDTTYYWRVRPIDDLGNGAFADSFAFKVDTAFSVTLTSPADGHETTNGTVVFVWTGQNVDSYTWQLSRTSNFATILLTVADTSVPSCTKALPDPDTFYWRVIGQRVATNTFDTTGVRAIVLDTSVNQVSASQPADGHETTAINFLVGWTALADSVGIDSYAVEVSKNTSFSNIAFTDTVDGAFTNDTVTGLYNDTYYWRVRGVDDLANGGSYSTTRGFLTDTIVNAVSILQPADGLETVSLYVAFVWTAVSDSVGIDSYAVEVSKNTNFTNVITDTVDSGTTLSTPTGIYNDTYYWRMRAIDDLGNGGPYTATRGFVADTIVNTVSLSQPADGHETTAINIVVSWTALADSVGIDSYAVEVSKNTGFSNMIFTDTLDQALTSDTVTGLYNDTYYWRVRAVDDLGNQGTFSTARGFVTDTIVNTPTLSQPADGHETTAIDFQVRSEERRVGKEGRSRWSPYH